LLVNQMRLKRSNKGKEKEEKNLSTKYFRLTNPNRRNSRTSIDVPRKKKSKQGRKRKEKKKKKKWEIETLPTSPRFYFHAEEQRRERKKPPSYTSTTREGDKIIYSNSPSPPCLTPPNRKCKLVCGPKKKKREKKKKKKGQSGFYPVSLNLEDRTRNLAEVKKEGEKSGGIMSESCAGHLFGQSLAPNLGGGEEKKGKRKGGKKKNLHGGVRISNPALFQSVVFSQRALPKSDSRGGEKGGEEGGGEDAKRTRGLHSFFCGIPQSVPSQQSSSKGGGKEKKRKKTLRFGP